MSAEFSEEEKKVILIYGLEHRLQGNNEAEESKWRDLAGQIGRDWNEMCNAYNAWITNFEDHEIEYGILVS